MKTLNMSEFKHQLETQNMVSFRLQDGTLIPSHFHITEAGLSSKHMMDCGGHVRNEQWINLQIWVAGDTDHRLSPKKLLGILNKTEALYPNQDLPLEVEYQTNTIGRYNLNYEDGHFILTPKQTACLAKDDCGITSPTKESKADKNACCSTNKACC